MPHRSALRALLLCAAALLPIGCGGAGTEPASRTAAEPSGEESGGFHVPPGPREPRIEVPEILAAAAPLAPVEPLEHGPNDWPGWRGPRGDGTSDARDVPVEFGKDARVPNDVVWKQPIPGRGHSSPTVWGERVFLTTADDERQVQSVLCFDHATGERIWKADVHEGNFEPVDRMHPWSSHATPTVACDGRRVFASFLNGQAIWTTALDLDGNILWQRNVGEFDSKQGYGASPVLGESAVFVAGDNWGSGWLAALHRATGDVVWRRARPAAESFSSPLLAKSTAGDRLFLSGCNRVACFDPRTGDEVWSVPATSRQTIGTIVANDGLLVASGGWPELETVALSAETGEVLWRNNVPILISSPLVHEGQVYAFRDNGIAYCWNARTGELAWRERLGGKYAASPVLAEGNIHIASQEGRYLVIRANPQRCEIVADNRIGDEFFASPAICGGRIFLRAARLEAGNRQEFLYCFGAPTRARAGESRDAR